MSDEEETAEPSEVPEGAAVFPEIPAELGVNPLFLATLHAMVFLSGSDESLVNGPAAEEALGFMVEYLQRLDATDLRRVTEDIRCIVALAKQEKWAKAQIHFLQSFLTDHGIGQEGDS